jgi:hypothetical protein
MDNYNSSSLSFYDENKIDKQNTAILHNNYTIMKPIYSTDETLLCGIIEYNNKKYYVDLDDKDKIINFNKKFVFINETDIYPSYSCNYKRFNYLDFIFNYRGESVYYIFKNDNHCDLRKCNVEIYHFYHKKIIETYNVNEYIKGHYLTMGHDASIMKNPIWRINENGKEYLLMYCEKDIICKLCYESYQKILNYEYNFNNGNKITWYKHQNGYILCSINIYIHQLITGCYGNGKGTKNISVDHIDRNPLNNTLENLRISTRKEQQNNTKGIIPGTQKERSSKKELPEGISYQMLKKYVYYNREFYNKEKTKEREFFRVEHPKLDKHWCTTKSNKISIQTKLEEANKVVDDLENDIYPVKNEVALPKYVSLIINREKQHLVFEKRLEEKRIGLKMVLPEEYDLEEQLIILNEKIKQKYDGETIL